MVCHLLDNVLALKKFMGHKLTVVFLEVSEHIRHGAVDGFCCTIADIREIRFLDHVNYLLHESLFNSRNFSKKMHFLGVCDSNVIICVGCCAVRDNERT